MEISNRSVGPKEKKWLLWFAIISLCLTSLPYLIGMGNQGTDRVFSGFVFGVEDGNSYIAKMLDGANGSWLFTTPYSAYPQSGFLAYLPYLLLGKLAGGTAMHTQLVILYQIFRWVAGFLLIYSLYDFIAIFISDARLRRWGIFAILFGGGLGWLVLLNNGALWRDGLPLEFYSPENFGFLSFFGLPHLALARALLLWGMGRIIRSLDHQHSFRYSLITALFFGLLGFFQPLSLVTGWIVLAVFLLVRFTYELIKKRKLIPWIKQVFREIAPAAVVSLVWILYNFTAFQGSGSMSGWYQQNILSSPPLIEYLWAFLIMLPLSIAGIVYVIKNKIKNGDFLICWFVVSPVLAYLPVTVQRRLPEGIWIALVILALIGVSSFSEKYRIKIFALPSIIGACTTLVIFAGSLGAVLGHQFPLFRERLEINMFDFLTNEAQPGDVVLASFTTSNALPAWVPLHTITGHGPESMNFSEINQRVNEFYSAIETDQDRLELIDEFGVSYVIWGPYEQEIGSWEPDGSAYLLLIYQEDDYSVYQVIR